MKEAVPADYYVSELFPEPRFPRLQILTIAELFAGKQLEYPRWVPPKTFKKAARRYKGPTTQRAGEILSETCRIPPRELIEKMTGI